MKRHAWYLRALIAAIGLAVLVLLAVLAIHMPDQVCIRDGDAIGCTSQTLKRALYVIAGAALGGGMMLWSLWCRRLRPFDGPSN